MTDGLKLALDTIKRDDEDNAGPRTLRPGITDEYRLAKAVIEYAKALREATGIGIASYAAYVGAYESLNDYKRRQWDRLNALAAKADGLPGDAQGDILEP